MLLKLLKYDFRKTKRYGIPIILSILAITIIGCLNMLILCGQGDSVSFVIPSPYGNAGGITTAITIGGLIIAFMALAAAGTVMYVLLIVQFYKTTVTDEAYLTFTLPVGAGQIVLSKLINSLIWMIYVTLALIFAIVLIAAAGLSVSDYTFNDIYEVIEDIHDMFSVFGGMLSVVLSVLSYSVQSVASFLQIYLAITFGSVIVRKHKALAGVGMIFGINFIVSTLTSVFSFIFFGGSSIKTPLDNVFYNFADGINGMLICKIILYLILSAGCFGITRSLMEKKLNLE